VLAGPTAATGRTRMMDLSEMVMRGFRSSFSLTQAGVSRSNWT